MRNDKENQNCDVIKKNNDCDCRFIYLFKKNSNLTLFLILLVIPTWAILRE